MATKLTIFVDFNKLHNDPNYDPEQEAVNAYNKTKGTNYTKDDMTHTEVGVVTSPGDLKKGIEATRANADDALITALRPTISLEKDPVSGLSTINVNAPSSYFNSTYYKNTVKPQLEQLTNLNVTAPETQAAFKQVKDGIFESSAASWALRTRMEGQFGHMSDEDWESVQQAYATVSDPDNNDQIDNKIPVSISTTDEQSGISEWLGDLSDGGNSGKIDVGGSSDKSWKDSLDAFNDLNDDNKYKVLTKLKKDKDDTSLSSYQRALSSVAFQGIQAAAQSNAYSNLLKTDWQTEAANMPVAAYRTFTNLIPFSNKVGKAIGLEHQIENLETGISNLESLGFTDTHGIGNVIGGVTGFAAGMVGDMILFRGLGIGVNSALKVSSAAATGKAANIIASAFSGGAQVPKTAPMGYKAVLTAMQAFDPGTSALWAGVKYLEGEDENYTKDPLGAYAGDMVSNMIMFGTLYGAQGGFNWITENTLTGMQINNGLKKLGHKFAGSKVGRFVNGKLSGEDFSEQIYEARGADIEATDEYIKRMRSKDPKYADFKNTPFDPNENYIRAQMNFLDMAREKENRKIFKENEAREFGNETNISAAKGVRAVRDESKNINNERLTSTRNELRKKLNKDDPNLAKSIDNITTDERFGTNQGTHEVIRTQTDGTTKVETVNNEPGWVFSDYANLRQLQDTQEALLAQDTVARKLRTGVALTATEREFVQNYKAANNGKLPKELKYRAKVESKLADVKQSLSQNPLLISGDQSAIDMAEQAYKSIQRANARLADLRSALGVEFGKDTWTNKLPGWRARSDYTTNEKGEFIRRPDGEGWFKRETRSDVETAINSAVSDKIKKSWSFRLEPGNYINPILGLQRQVDGLAQYIAVRNARARGEMLAQTSDGADVSQSMKGYKDDMKKLDAAVEDVNKELDNIRKEDVSKSDTDKFGIIDDALRSNTKTQNTNIDVPQIRINTTIDNPVQLQEYGNETKELLDSLNAMYNTKFYKNQEKRMDWNTLVGTARHSYPDAFVNTIDRDIQRLRETKDGKAKLSIVNKINEKAKTYDTQSKLVHDCGYTMISRHRDFNVLDIKTAKGKKILNNLFNLIPAETRRMIAERDVQTLGYLDAYRDGLSTDLKSILDNTVIRTYLESKGLHYIQDVDGNRIQIASNPRVYDMENTNASIKKSINRYTYSNSDEAVYDATDRMVDNYLSRTASNDAEYKILVDRAAEVGLSPDTLSLALLSKDTNLVNGMTNRIYNIHPYGKVAVDTNTRQLIYAFHPELAPKRSTKRDPKVEDFLPERRKKDGSPYAQDIKSAQKKVDQYNELKNDEDIKTLALQADYVSRADISRMVKQGIQDRLYTSLAKDKITGKQLRLIKDNASAQSAIKATGGMSERDGIKAEPELQPPDERTVEGKDAVASTMSQEDILNTLNKLGTDEQVAKRRELVEQKKQAEKDRKKAERDKKKAEQKAIKEKAKPVKKTTKKVVEKPKKVVEKPKKGKTLAEQLKGGSLKTEVEKKEKKGKTLLEQLRDGELTKEKK